MEILEHTCGADENQPTAFGFFVDHLSTLFKRDERKAPKAHINDFISLVSLYGLALKNCPRCLSLL